MICTQFTTQKKENEIKDFFINQINNILYVNQFYYTCWYCFHQTFCDAVVSLSCSILEANV